MFLVMTQFTLVVFPTLVTIVTVLTVVTVLTIKAELKEVTVLKVL